MVKCKTCLWSGGLDSTYMIYKFLSEGYHVDAYYIKLQNNAKKTRRELDAIKNLVSIFSKFDFTYKGVLSEFLINNVSNSISLYQPLIWLMSSAYLDGEINIGYVMNDDAISYIDDFKNIVSALNKIRSTPFQIDFPLTKFKKEDIINFLPKIYQDHIVYCESENKNNCGKCGPCIRHAESIKKVKSLKMGEKHGKIREMGSKVSRTRKTHS